MKGQYFEFRGDDDVWVFINNRLVVDIGGCHSPIEGSVNLDTLGLVEGNEYPFHIFFSERNATGSNFKMRTSINLQTEKTYYPVEIPTSDGTIQYEIWQMLVDESLSCDVSSVTKVDTIPAASLFILMGPGLPEEGDTLAPGVNYGGCGNDGWILDRYECRGEVENARSGNLYALLLPGIGSFPVFEGVFHGSGISASVDRFCGFSLE